MINVADIANQAIPQPAAAPPAQTGEGDDFFDHLLREVERQDVDRQEAIDRESATDETAADKPADAEGTTIAAEATPVAPAPAAVPWPLVAAAAEILTQATATTPAPAPTMPAVAMDAAPIRTLREAAPASPAGATPDSATPISAAAGATASAGNGKGNSGDLGFKTDLGSVFAALNASEGGVTPDDFQSLVATHARNTAEAPAAGDMKAPAPVGTVAPATASAGAAITAAQAPLNANHAEASQAASARPSAQHAAANPATMQISVQMIRAIGDGVSKISVDLNPAELGRVEVKIEVGRDGRVQGTVTADRQDTFDMLQRDSRALERALQDAGLKADPQSLSFNLRGESQQGRTAPENPAARADMREAAVAEELPPPPPPSRPSNMPTGAIDIRV